MVETICYFNKDALVIKPPKKSPLVLRTVVLIFAMVCGVYICSICIKEESACNPVRYFAILSMQRSGSGWFETLLNSHINVSSNGEIFSVKLRRSNISLIIRTMEFSVKLRRSNISLIIRTMDKVYNLDRFTSASKDECSAAVGLKWMMNQTFHFMGRRDRHRVELIKKHMPFGYGNGLMAHHNDIVAYFKEKGVSSIFLFRRNLLRRMIFVIANSYDRDAKLLNGTHKSHVHSPAEAKILAKYKPTINATLLVHEMKQIDQITAKATEYFKSTRHIVLCYEDLVTNRTKLKEVQNFLRLPYRELTSRQVKIDQVENWDDVQKALNGASYEKFLHSDYQM